MTEHDTQHSPSIAAHLRGLSPDAFAALGTGQLAYVRPFVDEDTSGFAIHAANGQQLTAVDERDTAFALIRQNDLEPLSVH